MSVCVCVCVRERETRFARERVKNVFYVNKTWNQDACKELY